MSKITKSLVNEIISLREDKLSVIKIALKLRLSPATVTKYLRLNNFVIQRKTPLKTSEEDIKLMRKLRKEGYTLTEIAKRTGYCMLTVSLYTSDPNSNYVNRKNRKWDRKLLSKLLSENDYSYALIADKYGYKRSYIKLLAFKFQLNELANEKRDQIRKERLKKSIDRIKELHKKGYSSNEIYEIMYKDKELKKGISFIQQVINIADL
jgi:hypothetical protein